MKEKMVQSANKQKLLHIELIRLVACFFVIFTHTEYRGYYLFSTYADTSVPFWTYLSMTVFAGIAVPSFFAISGALMLNRPEEPLTTLWLKRVLRYGILIILACFMYYVQAQDFDLAELNVKEFIIILYSYSSGGITWFLYSYLAYLILLPVLSTMAKNLKNEYFIYIFAIALLYNGVIPILEYAVFQGTQSLNSAFAIDWIVSKVVLFPLLGYYLEHRMDETQRKKWLGRLWVATFCGIVLSCMMTVYRGRLEGAYIENESSTFFSCFVLISCSAVYLTARKIVSMVTFSDWTVKAICSVSRCTLGIYILHFFVMRLPFAVAVRDSILRTGMNSMLASVLFCLFIMLLCYALTLILKKIPGLNKLL